MAYARVRRALAVSAVAVTLGMLGANRPPTAAADAPASGAVISVQLLGAVTKPGAYKLAEGSRLSDLFVAAGIRLPTDDPRNMPLSDVPAATGACSVMLGDLRQVYLIRPAGGKHTGTVVDLARAHDDPRQDPPLLDGDRVFVPQCRTVKVKVIAEPGR